jgi:tetratricopeptide (TPR) repeat protein
VLRRIRDLVRNSRATQVALGAVTLAVIALSAWRVGRNLWARAELQAARMALDLGKVGEARSHLVTCLNIRPDDPDVHFLLARVARRSGDAKEADERLRQAKRLGAVPEEVQLERQLQDVQRGYMGPLEKQLLIFTEKDHPDTIDILDALAHGYLVTFRLNQARDVLDRLIKLQPGHAPAWVLRGKAMYHLRGYAEAAHDYGRAVELAPDDAEARLLLAECLFENAQPEQALEHFDVLDRREQPVPNADSLAVPMGRARCLLELGRTDDAREALARLQKLAPGNFNVLTLYGKLALRELNPAGAESWLRKAVELEPGDRDSVYSLALCLQQQRDEGKKTEAATWFQQVKLIESQQSRLADVTAQILSAPHDPLPRLRAGEIFLTLGNDREGLRWLYSALQQDPNHQPTHRLLRDHFRRKGQPERAAVHEKALGKE